MLNGIRALRGWALWVRLLFTATALALLSVFQVPLETEVPGEPFLLFFIAVIGATLVFGERVGLFAVVLSTILSLLFFEPIGTLTLSRAADLVKVELYAILAGLSVLAVAQFGRAIDAAEISARSLEESEKNRSILFKELAHRVANNFAVVATLIRAKAGAVSDNEAKSVLNDAMEQVTVMARIHRHLYAGAEVASLDSEHFLSELCDGLKHSMARGRPISIQCVAVSRRLPVAQAVPIGLIINELVTNAIKHGFPDGRSGTILVSLEERSQDKLLLTVEDDGIGLSHASRKSSGRSLVAVLAQQLGGHFECSSNGSCSAFRVTFPHEGERQIVPSLPRQMAH